MAATTQSPSEAIVLQTPKQGELITGANFQLTREQIMTVPKAAFMKRVNESIRIATATHKAATAAQTQARETYDALVKGYEPPAEFIRDLKAVADAMGKFQKGLKVTTKIEADDDEEMTIRTSVDVHGKKIHLTGYVYMAGRTAMYTATKTYALPSGILTAHTACEKVAKEVAKAVERLGELRDLKANVPHMAEEFIADAALHQLGQTAEGQELRRAMDAAVDAKALEYGLVEISPRTALR